MSRIGHQARAPGPRALRGFAFSPLRTVASARLVMMLLVGLLVYLQNGLIEAKAVSDATAKFRSDSDPLGRFLNDCVEQVPGERVQTSTLYAVFAAWAQANGERIWKHNGFSRAMIERGFVSRSSASISGSISR
jgi:phage/plasmid-associated DNA primase